MAGPVRLFAKAAALTALLPAVLVGGLSLAAPAPEAPPSSDEAGTDKTYDAGAVSKAQSRLEGSMAQLGKMAQAAKADGDAQLAGCLEDKVTRAQDIMSTATPELMVLRDSTASAQAKSFAAEKLQAAANAMDGVMASAKGCSGEQELEDRDDVTRNELDKTDGIPIQDPTIAPTEPDIPPAIDEAQPPTVASPSA
ncbi:MAG: hypothetical protein ACRBN8_45445 [Nannocystales bacterium]